VSDAGLTPPTSCRAPPADVRPTQILDHSILPSTPITDFHSRTRLCQNCHLVVKTALGLPLTCISFINCLLCLSSPPCETWVFDLITRFASCWGRFFFDDQSLNSPLAEDSEDSYMFSKRNRLLLLLVNSRRVHINHENLGRLLSSTRTWHRRCLSTFYCLGQSAILLCPSE